LTENPIISRWFYDYETILQVFIIIYVPQEKNKGVFPSTLFQPSFGFQVPEICV